MWTSSGSFSDKGRADQGIQKLSSSQVKVSRGSALGLDSISPKSLACDPQAQLIGVCTKIGHVRLFGPEFEFTLLHPCVPAEIEFLLFPRPGLVFALGPSRSQDVSGQIGQRQLPWIAAWWDLQLPSRVGSAGKLDGSGSGIPGRACMLRFQVPSVSTVREAGLVYMGTDEGDVRIFDGRSHAITPYCIPAVKLARFKSSRACPVTALAAAPKGAPELLVANAEGNVVLWDFNSNQVARQYTSGSAVVSLAWNAEASSFIASSRSEICAYSRGNSAPVLRVALPGGPASDVSILHWSGTCSASNGGSAGNSTLSDNKDTNSGNLIIWRDEPKPAVLCLSGLNLANVDDLLGDSLEGSAVAATLWMPRTGCVSAPGEATDVRESIPSSLVPSGLPCGCILPPTSAHNNSLSADSPSLAVLERFASIPLVLVATSSPRCRIFVRTAPPMRPMLWPATWCSLELTGVTALEMTGVRGQFGSLIRREDRTTVDKGENTVKDVEANTKSSVPDFSDRVATQVPSVPADIAIPITEESESQVADNSQENASAACAGDAEPSVKFVEVLCVESGVLHAGVTALPVGRESIEPSDGLFLCLAEDDGGDGGDEGLCCSLPCDSVETTTCISFGLDACAEVELCFTGSDDIATCRFDAGEQKISWRSPGRPIESEAECFAIELEPGADQTVLLSGFQDSGGLSLQVDGKGIVDSLALGGRTVGTINWRSRAGEIRIRNLTVQSRVEQAGPAAPRGADSERANEAMPSEQPVPPLPRPAVSEDEQTPVRLVEAMFSRRFANFQSAANGVCCQVSSWQFLDTWCAVVGGWQEVFCSGHVDGTVRLWLRAHSSTLLLYTVSLRLSPQTTWRPTMRVDGAGSENVNVGHAPWYDGVDACPTFADPALGEYNDCERAVTAVTLDMSTVTLAAGTRSGCLVVFRWFSESGNIPKAELERWQDLVSSGCCSEASNRSEGISGPRLPVGFACLFRNAVHKGLEITNVRFAHVGKNLRLLSTDVASGFCCTDGHTGDILWQNAAVTKVTSMASVPPSPPPPPAEPSPPAPPPPAETVQAVELSDCILRMKPAGTENLKGQVPTSASLAMFAASQTPGVEALLFLLSSGEMRQLTATDHRILDVRVQETRLPNLPPGDIRLFRLTADQLVAVRPTSAHVLPRSSEGYMVSPWTAKQFSVPVVSAGVVDVCGADHLAVLLSSHFVEFFTLPGLQMVASLDARAGIDPFTNSGRCSFGTFAGSHGYLCAALGDAGGLWTCSTLASMSALDSAAWSVSTAHLAQALLQAQSVGSDAADSSPTRECDKPKSKGFFGGLFGGNKSQKSLRDCVLPDAGAQLPAEVNANSLDEENGLGPAWKDFLSELQSPAGQPCRDSDPNDNRFDPPARVQAKTSANPCKGQGFGVDASFASKSAAAALAEASAAAHERGDSLNSLGTKTSKLSDDAGGFLNLAKQLNKKQNSWF